MGAGPALERLRMEVGADLYDWSLEAVCGQFRERLEQLRTSDLQALEEQKQACEEQIRDKEETLRGIMVISAAGRMPFRT